MVSKQKCFLCSIVSVSLSELSLNFCLWSILDIKYCKVPSSGDARAQRMFKRPGISGKPSLLCPVTLFPVPKAKREMVNDWPPPEAPCFYVKRYAEMFLFSLVRFIFANYHNYIPRFRFLKFSLATQLTSSIGIGTVPFWHFYP